ncbi:MAG TPA: hypothetical protein VFZ18_15065 [Longimicrobiaceae bacterium]|jgi:hypothetical protein
MRSFLPTLLLSLAIAAPLAATEVEAPEAAPVPTVAVEAPADAADAPVMHLEEIQVEQRNTTAAADAAQFPARGSFWWLVGVIVVAGVILVLLLD